MRNSPHPWLLLALLTVFGSGAPAWVGASGWAGFALPEPVGPRAEAMGREVACLETGPMAAWGNAGGLGLSRGVQVAGSRARLAPFGDNSYSYYGSGVLSFRVGTQHHLTLGANFTRGIYEPIETAANFAWSNYYETVYGMAAGFGFGERLGVGLGVKWVHDRVAGFTLYGPEPEVLSTNGPVLDIGALSRLPLTRLSSGVVHLTSGLALHNVGGKLSLAPDAPGSRLPRAARVGLGLEWHRASSTPLEQTSRGGSPGDGLPTTATIRVGLQKLFRSKDPSDSMGPALPETYLTRHAITLGGGGEVEWFNMLAVRAGYLYDELLVSKGATWGFGLNLRHVARFDFASVPTWTYSDRVKKFSVWLRLPFGHDS